MEEWRKRLADRMVERGMTAAELTRSAGVGPTMVHDILNRGATPSIQNLSKIAKALGTTIAFLYDGDHSSKPLSITLLGVNRGGDMFVSIGDARKASVPLHLLDETCVFVKIESSTFGDKFRAGDVIGGPRVSGNLADELLGKECIVCTADNSQLIRIVVRGTKANRYNLRSFNPHDDDVRDAQIKWAAPIKFIFRA